MTSIRRILGLGAMALTCVGISSATSIVQTFTLPTAPLSDATTWTSSSSINQFNTALGTLEDIIFTVSYNTTVSGAATDDNVGSTGTDHYDFSGVTNMNLGDPTNTIILAPSTTVSAGFNNKSYNDTMSIASAPASGSISVTYVTDPTNPLAIFCGSYVTGCRDLLTGLPSSVNPLNVSNYLGTGTISLTGNAQTFAAFSGPSYRNASGSGTADMTVTVQYDYLTTPPPPGTPEPATMALMGSALVGLGLLRKRIKS